MKIFRFALIGAMFLAAPLSSLQAQSDGAAIGFDPRDSCAESLMREGDLEKLMIAAWAYGYLAATQGSPGPVDLENAKVMIRNISKVCGKNTQLTMLDIVAGSRAPTADVAGSEANARVMLEKFLVPGADLVTLTAALIPNESDVRAVFEEPLASRLIANLLPRFQPGMKFQPKPEHDAILTAYATTDQLKNRDPVLRDFPGGYEKLLPYLKPGFPIMRFKFVKSGETLGLAFDGLIFVNGRWVIIPKAWSYIE